MVSKHQSRIRVRSDGNGKDGGLRRSDVADTIAGSIWSVRDRGHAYSGAGSLDFRSLPGTCSRTQFESVDCDRESGLHSPSSRPLEDTPHCEVASLSGLRLWQLLVGWLRL